MQQDRVRFPLTSDQCELLAAFERAESLADLGKAMHKDISVISRNLQALASTGVLEKLNNRWVLTPLGRQINNWTRTVSASQLKILNQESRLRFLSSKLPAVGPDTALLSIGMQNGFDDPIWTTRNNLHAEENATKIIDAWRTSSRPLYHVQHQSKEPQSPLKNGTIGCDFKEATKPRGDEIIFRKSANSAFIGTDLERTLRERGHLAIVLFGFTTNHCVDATAKMAGDLGFSVFVVADCCVAFDRIAPDGSLVKADESHRVIMSNLNQEFASVIDTEVLLNLSSTPIT